MRLAVPSPLHYRILTIRVLSVSIILYFPHCMGHTWSDLEILIIHSNTQGWALTTKGGIKHHSLCLTNEVGNLYLGVCDGDSKQQFQHTSDGLVVHTASGLCMTMDSRQAGPVLVACEDSDLWEFVFPS